MSVDVKSYITKHQRDTDLWEKVSDMVQYSADVAETDLNDVKFKHYGVDVANDDVIKAVLNEQGFDYIVSVMDTITNFEFNTLISYIDLINQLKGTRDGLELVLRLLGFDSVIREWWEEPDNPQEPWTYEIIVLMNTSIVPDIFKTLARVQTFSRNYVFAQISNVEIRFIFSKFAEKGTIMDGFSHATYFGNITERAF